MAKPITIKNAGVWAAWNYVKLKKTALDTYPQGNIRKIGLTQQSHNRAILFLSDTKFQIVLAATVQVLNGHGLISIKHLTFSLMYFSSIKLSILAMCSLYAKITINTWHPGIILSQARVVAYEPDPYRLIHRVTLDEQGKPELHSFTFANKLDPSNITIYNPEKGEYYDVARDQAIIFNVPNSSVTFSIVTQKITYLVSTTSGPEVKDVTTKMVTLKGQFELLPQEKNKVNPTALDLYKKGKGKKKPNTIKIRYPIYYACLEKYRKEC